MHAELLPGCGCVMKAWFIPPIVVPAAIAIALVLIAFLRMG
jgi:hypothetical protein